MASGARVAEIQYRKLSRERGSFDLEVTLAEALRRTMRVNVEDGILAEQPTKRLQNVDGGDTDGIRCWNNQRFTDSGIFGTICLYKPNALQALIDANAQDGAGAFDIDQISSVSGKNFLKGIAYFGVFDDHLYIIQSPSLQTSAFEEYFTWILKARGDLIPDSAFVLFDAAFDREVVGVELEDIESISLSGGLNIGLNEAPIMDRGQDAEATTSEKITALDAVRLRGNFLEKVKNLLRDVVSEEHFEDVERSIADLKLEDPNASLEASIEFVVRSRSRNDSAAESRRKAARVLQGALSSIPGPLLSARGKDGSIKGDEIRLKERRTIKLASPPDGAPRGATSVLLDFDDVVEQLFTVHSRFVEDGKITS